MGILTWIVMGAIIAILTELILPDSGPGGTVLTILLGIAGASVGGFIGTFFGIGSVTGYSTGSLVLAVAGALILLIVFRLLKKK